VKKIAILLAVYNSSLYLNELINSIVNQSYLDWTLYIRDDGSTDGTLNIVNDYCNIYSSNIILLEDKVKGRGSKNSFMWLLSKVNSDYYMFCDHDDVWLPNKIEKSISQMLVIEKMHLNSPIIVHSDLAVTDNHLNIIHSSFWSFSRTPSHYSSSFSFHCAYNNVTGCTMLINCYARNLSMDIPSSAKMHDSWIALVVLFNRGFIESIAEPLTLYRQHTDNVIGARKSRSIIQKMRNIKIILGENIQLYQTINYLSRMSLFNFVCNKTKYYLIFVIRGFLRQNSFSG